MLRRQLPRTGSGTQGANERKRPVNLQQPDGSWANPNGRWWEKDPNLVTAYAVLALEIIHRGI